MVNPKVKGNEWERKSAKALSFRLTEGNSEYAIWRSNSSGGHSTILAKKQKEAGYASKQVGDLVATGNEWEHVNQFFDLFFVECKALKDFSLMPPVNKKKKTFSIKYFGKLKLVEESLQSSSLRGIINQS